MASLGRADTAPSQDIEGFVSVLLRISEGTNIKRLYGHMSIGCRIS